MNHHIGKASSPLAGRYHNQPLLCTLPALLSDIELPAAGTYTIYVAAYTGEGEYTLTLNTSEALAVGAIAYDQTVQGELSGGQPQVWTFDAQPGDVVEIALNAVGEDVELDTQLELQGPDGEEVAANDDSGDTRNSLISGVPLLRAGTYNIVVSSFSGEGPYELTLRRSEAVGGGAIPAEGTAQGELTAGQPQLWTFEGQEGETVSIAANAPEDSDLDLRITLYDAAGEELSSDDDGGDGLNSLISEFSLPGAGTYYILVETFNESGEGAYTVEVTRQ